MDFFPKSAGKIHWREVGGIMNFVKTFYHTLTTPEEWSLVSILLVGEAMAFLMAALAVNAFDAQF